MPSRLGRYAVRERVGSGAFATVWLAYDEQLDSPVAIKVLADNWTDDRHVRARFQEEGRFLRKVESPYVVSVYDAGELEDGRPYLVMSYADRGTLADRLEVGGLTPSQAMGVIRQVGLGLEALHRRGVLHRDVKPANVLFRTVEPTPGPGEPGEIRAMLGDLGLGKALDMSSRLTMIAGTPSFVAPEQAQGERLDPRTDQYSLAALTYLLLTGRAAYAHASLAAAAAPGPPPSVSTPDRVFPAPVDDVVHRGLAIEREDRWPDVSAYVGALGAALGHGSTGSPRQTWPPPDSQLTQPGARPATVPEERPQSDPVAPNPRWRRPLLATLGLVVLATGAAGGYLVVSRTDRDVTVADGSGSLEVTVPSAWDRVRAPEAWTPPKATGELPSLSVGSAADWTDPGSAGEGIFVGLLPGSRLPTAVPQHPECTDAEEPVTDETDGDPSVTVVSTGCPSGVTVERVVQVTLNRLLWVQVRSVDRATANAVLDAVDVKGM